MKRRTLSAPIRNNLRSWRRAGALMLLFLSSACGETRVSTDTRTNWLSSCSDDVSCGGGLACVCGVCTQSCESGQSCGEVSSEAVCVEVPGCQQASQVCAKEGFFDAPTDGSVVNPVDASSTRGSDVDAAQSSQGATAVISTSSSAPFSPTVETVDDASRGEDEGLDASAATTSEHSSAESGTADPCDAAGREYVSRDPVECEELTIDCGFFSEGVGKIGFDDACGCGCEPYVVPPRTDSITAGECAASPPSGTPANFAVLAESSTTEVLCGDVPTALLRSYAEMAEWAGVSGCGEVASLMADVDFASQSVIVVGTPERPSASVSYIVQTIDGTIHVGVDADAYCGGARPTSGFVLVTVNAGASTALRVTTETCFDACPDDGGLPVP